MTFRANESEKKGNDWAIEYLVGPNIDPDHRENSVTELWDIVNRYGPSVDSYPNWHPLVSIGNEQRNPLWNGPESNENYQSLDHTVYFRNAFITCPYGEENANAVLESVRNLPSNPDVDISAELLDFQLYNPMATPILVTCEWAEPLNRDGSIPTRLAVPLMIEFEASKWREAKAAESWKTMQSYVLGRPYGSRSSLFVDQECGQYLKKTYSVMINSGMYGPIYPHR